MQVGDKVALSALQSKSHVFTIPDKPGQLYYKQGDNGAIRVDTGDDCLADEAGVPRDTWWVIGPFIELPPNTEVVIYALRGSSKKE